MSVEAFGIHLAVLALERLRRLRFLACRVWRPNDEMRVSFSTLLRVTDGGRFLLVRNLHRPELFAPFGGVYKYYEEAKPHLDAVSFRPQDLGRGDDMKNDLRGFLPRRYMPKLVKWYDERTLRETAESCVMRELREELREIRLTTRVPLPREIPVKPVRIVLEGPERIPGKAYTQYRIFEVFEVASGAPEAVESFGRLFEIASVGHDHLLSVSSDEIVSGRARDGRRIGSHTAYLIGTRRIHPNEPPF